MNVFNGWHRLQDKMPQMFACVLVYDKNVNSVFAAYIDGDAEFRVWCPDDSYDEYEGYDALIQFQVDLWCYPPYPDGAEELEDQE